MPPARRIRLIGDGDLSAGIAAAVSGSGVHAVMGTGGAPEDVLTAAAMRCLNGEIFARLVVDKPEHEERCKTMGITNFKKVYRSDDLASGRSIIFAATGVTDGALMKGVRLFGDGIRTSSLVMQTQSASDSLHRQHPGVSRPGGEDPILSTLAHAGQPERLRLGGGRLHRLHGLHARDAVPAADASASSA